MTSASRQRRCRLLALMVAQDCRCAGCGYLMDPELVGAPGPDAPTLDHVDTLSAQRRRGGRLNNSLSNLLAKHRDCNERRGNRRPTQSDREWQAKVAKALPTVPTTFQHRAAMARVIYAHHREEIAA